MTRIVTPVGVAAASWTTRLRDEPAIEALELLHVGRGDHAVVIAAHPDDETLGIGGTLHQLGRAGTAVTIIVATDGEAAYGDDGPPPAELAGRRRAELVEAMLALGLTADIRFLGLPDGHLSSHEAELTDAVSAVLHDVARQIDVAAAQPRTVVLATWLNDPHPDHAAVGRAARTAALASGCDLWWYPIWLRDRCEPTDDAVPWSQLRIIRLGAEEQQAKAGAIAAHASQITGPSDDIGPVLPMSAIGQFTDGYELLVASAPSTDGLAAHFDAAHGSTPAWTDPTSWYERRKRAVLLASLPDETYDCAWEPGASVGRLTVELAKRCRRVLASDVSAVAVEAAIAATAGLSGVEVALAHTPDDEPPVDDGSCDLVMLAEVLYYLDPTARARTLALARRLLAPHGHVVVVHWRRLPDDAYCSGADANREVVGHFPRHLVHHDDESFVLDVVAL